MRQIVKDRRTRSSAKVGLEGCWPHRYGDRIEAIHKVA